MVLRFKWSWPGIKFWTYWKKYEKTKNDLGVPQKKWFGGTWKQRNDLGNFEVLDSGVPKNNRTHLDVIKTLQRSGSSHPSQRFIAQRLRGIAAEISVTCGLAGAGWPSWPWLAPKKTWKTLGFWRIWWDFVWWSMGSNNNVLLVKIEGPVWYTGYRHYLLLMD